MLFNRFVSIIFFGLFLSLAYADGEKDCDELLLGARFLHAKFPTLYKDPAVQSAAEKTNFDGHELSQPEQKINIWLSYLKATAREKQADPQAFDKIKEWFHRQYVTPADQISDSYFQLQVRLVRERGEGNIVLTHDNRRLIAEVAIRDQTASLDEWLSYLLFENAENPMWVRYWVLLGVTKLSKFDPVTLSFQNRSRGQGAPFPELNPEALALVIDDVIKKVRSEQPADLEGLNFGRMYSKAWVTSMRQKRDLSVTQGQWRKYTQGSDPAPLVKSLQGMNTGWCTAGFSTAEGQLNGGDFYVYYSNDASGSPIIPRIAIRMEGEHIAEVRGIAEHQNLDSDIAGSDILEKKLIEFGSEGPAYLKKSRDMKRLTEIERKLKGTRSLDKEDLRFLYEVDEPMQTFGRVKDPRIQEILWMRDVKADIAYALGINKDEVTVGWTELEPALKGGIKFHYGDLFIDKITSAEAGLDLPRRVTGQLYMPALTSAVGVKLPEYVGGTLNLPQLTSQEGLILPKYVGGDLELYGLISANGLTLPEFVGGDMLLWGVNWARHVKFPRFVGGNLDMGNLIVTNDVTLPLFVGGVLDLSRLVSLRGLNLPKSVGGDIWVSRRNFRRIQGKKQVPLLPHVGGSLRTAPWGRSLRAQLRLNFETMFIYLIHRFDNRLPSRSDYSAD